MSVSFLEAVAELWMDLGLEGNPPASVVGQTGMKARICHWIQRADIAIQNKWQNWSFLHASYSAASISGSPVLTAPTDLGTWDCDSFTVDETPMICISYEEWRTAYQFDTSTGKPWAFAVKPDRNLVLVPIPDGAYSIQGEYYKAAQKVKGNSDSLHVPDRFERAVLTKAAEYYARQEEVALVLQEAVREHKEIMDQMEAIYLSAMRESTAPGTPIHIEIE